MPRNISSLHNSDVLVSLPAIEAADASQAVG